MQEDLEMADIIIPSGLDCQGGAIRAVYPIQDAIILIHGGTGCTFLPKFLFAFHDNYIVRCPTTGMLEKHVIYGGEELLEESLEKAIETFNPELIVIQGSVIPFLIGDDIAGIASLVSKKRGIKIIALSNPNYKGNQLDGYKHTVNHYVTDIMEPPKQQLDKSVNLLGVFPGEYNWRNDLKEGLRLLRALGLTINSVLVGDQIRVKDIALAPQAQANVLFYPEVGLSAAQLMEEKFGIPVIDTKFPPIGSEATKDWISQIAQFFGLEREAEELLEKEMEEMSEGMARIIMGQVQSIEWLFGKTYAIWAAPFQIPGMVKFLYEDLSMIPTTIALAEYDSPSHNKLLELLKNFGLDPEVQITGDHPSYLASLQRDYNHPYGDPWLAFGSTTDALSLCHAGVPLPVIRTSFPVFDEVIVTNRPFVGFRGVITLTESIINTLGKKVLLTDQAFGNIPHPMKIAEELVKAWG
jgi:nitrogenase molybdenum-iron protein beta chain